MYEDWPTIKETIARTGMSERTLYRRMQDDTLRQAYRKVPGRKPILVLHPDDVAKLEAETVKAVVMPPETIEVPAVNQPDRKLPSSGWMAELTELARNLVDTTSQVKLSEKFMLTLDEAVQLSGFTRAYLERAIHDRRLPAMKDRGYKIFREHLWQYAATGRVAGSLEKSHTPKRNAPKSATGRVTA